MTSSNDFSKYQVSLNKLNELQAITAIKSSDKSELRKQRLTNTMNMCHRLGLNESDFNNLNIIHMTGTKGKGSTCAFLESILRQSGFKTGLFSSPHLIEVRERIKIGGQALSYEKFQEYFEHCHELLINNELTGSDSYDKPSYFQFLTCMMFYVFVRENVSAAIVEVGIGGEYDFTNIIPNPTACGITSLGLDHCSILGYTYEEIAWQKSGIFKPSCLAFTVEQNSDAATETLKQRAHDKNVPLLQVPTIDEYTESSSIKLGLHGDVQKINSALALQIAKYWIEKQSNKELSKQKWIEENTDTVLKNGLPLLKPVDINENLKNGLSKCFWPGRNQIIRSKDQKITYYLDGAHTSESIGQFVDWFKECNRNTDKQKNVLLFNYTGERDTKSFEKLLEMKFDSVAFSKLNAYPTNINNSSCDNVRKMPSATLDTDEKYKNIVKSFLDIQMKDSNNNKRESINYKIFSNIHESLMWLTEGKDENLASQLSEEINSENIEPAQDEKINVLITGSLYLVGLSLKVLHFKTA